MKLRTKIILITIAFLVVSVLISSAFVFYSSYKKTLESVRSASESEFHLIKNTVQTNQPFNLPRDIIAKRSSLIYQFSKTISPIAEGTYYILQNDKEVLSNNWGYDARALLAAMGMEPGNAAGQNRTAHCVVWLSGTPYLLLSGDAYLYDGDYTISIAKDLSGELADLVNTIWESLAVFALMIVLSSIGLLFTINRAFKPIHSLQEKTRLIASGNYEIPFDTEGNDEVAQLSKDFDHMAREIQEKMDQLSQVADDQKILMTALAHEMKTPVTVISGYTHALARSKLSGEQKQEAAINIQQEVSRLERLWRKITELLSVPNQALQLEACAATKIQAAVSKLVDEVNRDEHVKIDYLVDQSIYACDLDLITCLIMNLIDNSIKASASEITLTFKENCITVADNGKGIPQALASKVMNPFFVANPSRNQEGFGLGLTICNAIANAHNAQLRIDSVMGQGTRIALCFQ